MIHPSTMAGANWTTGNFGTTNPFQQSSMPFLRTTPFQGPQTSYGPGISPLQNQPFGTNPMHMQNTINEVVRQIVPRVLASGGIQSPMGIPSPFGFQPPIGQQGQFGLQPPIGQQGQFGLQPPIGQQGQFGLQTPFASQVPTGLAPFGPQLQSSPWANPAASYGDSLSWQNQNPLQEVLRQATTQVIQSLYQQNPNLLLGLQSPSGGNWQQQQSLMSLVGQVCQAVASSVIECLTQPNLAQNMPYSMGNLPFATQQTPFSTPQTPLNFGSIQPQYGVTPGMPVGAGAF